MLILITNSCSMGCTHCMSECRSDSNNHMSLEVFDDVLSFIESEGLSDTPIIISGGEPTENPKFFRIMRKAINHLRFITVTTNGENIINTPEPYIDILNIADKAGCSLSYQVSTDKRFYPRMIDVNSDVFRDKRIILCEDCVERVYPQGRAIQNKITWKTVGPKCFNVRSLAKRVSKFGEISLSLAYMNKYCTPSIHYNGDIGLGESLLCPKCASIYDSSTEIVEKIREFHCMDCKEAINTLSPEYRSYL